MMIESRYLSMLSTASRILLASVGSYGVATLSALACLSLPTEDASRIYLGYFLSILICAVVILLAFSTKKAMTAWVYSVCLALLFLVFWKLGG